MLDQGIELVTECRHDAVALSAPGRPATGSEDDRLDPSGPGLEHHRVPHTSHAEGVLDVFGIDVQAVGQHDHVATAAHEDQPPFCVQPADVTRPIPAVGRERGRGRLGVMPVTLEQGGAGELDLAVLGEPHLDRRHGATHRSEAMVLRRVARPEAGLGRAVPLDDDDADVLPCLLDGRREERPGRHEQPEIAAQSPMNGAEDPAPRPVRQPPGDPPQPIEGLGAAGLLDFAFDRRPEQVQHLGHYDHRRGPVIADGLEDRARVAAADVQDVGAHIERVEQRHGLLEQVREGQQRDDPVLDVRDDLVHRPDRGEHVLVREHHALRRARRAAREDQLEDRVRGRAWPCTHLRLPVRRKGLIWIRGQVVELRGREILEPDLARICDLTAVPDDEPASLRSLRDAPNSVGRHPEVERNEDQAGPDGTDIRGGKLRRRGRPGEQPIAELQAERTEPPRRDQAPTLQLGVGPLHRALVVRAQAHGRLIGPLRDGPFDKVDQGFHSRREAYSREFLSSP